MADLNKNLKPENNQKNIFKMSLSFMKMKKPSLKLAELPLDPMNCTDVEKQIALLNYKMGQYLANNKEAKLTSKMFFKRYSWRICLVVFAAFLFNFSIQIFLSRADTVPSGWTGFPTLLQNLLPVIRPYFALIYFGANLPLFIIFWRKIKKSFLYLTLLFMVSQILANLIFTQDVIFTHITAFFDLVGDKLLTKDENGNPVHIEVALKLLKKQWYEQNKTWPILLYCSIGAFFVGVALALSWKAGGSTGGTDIIAYYYVTKSKKSISTMLSIFGFTTAMIFLVIWGVVEHSDKYKDELLIRDPGTFIGARELSTFLYILISNLVVGILYPKYKKMKMTIISSDINKVIAYLKLIEYWHSYKIVSFTSGYNGETKYKVETVLLLLESKNLINDLKLIDPNIWISMIPVHQVIGKFNTQFVEQ
ncbi:YitT family protein [Mycoplasmopsis columboralis]|uniref:Uncharacterized BCR, YitT family COG1284 n=1 Tax=Mycoplasmopsis columboralis TaxID=171282 RepID=A0A449B7F9_9BACT|nr:YitT family protein [Mycoplasmopsis columboralis]VEU76524.1 Uncharacterized BCR, YitT family COG1284 [Mycoplasmopsis columboralis]